MLIEALIPFFIIGFLISTVFLSILLWWWFKHHFWSLVAMCGEIHDRVFYRVWDALLGCKSKVVLKDKHTHEDMPNGHR